MFILGLAIQKNGSLIIINAAAAAELLIIFNFYLVVPEGNYSRRFERDNAGEANGPDTLCILLGRERQHQSHSRRMSFLTERCLSSFRSLLFSLSSCVCVCVLII
jgi:hypothetical protein